MPKLYSVEINIVATAYIVADSEEEARDLLDGIREEAIQVAEDRDADVPISGQSFSIEMPEISLSPAMTIAGPDEGYQLEFVEELEEET